MTAAQTTTATVSNAFNAFFSLEDLEARLAEYIGDNLVYCELTDTMQLADDCDTYNFIDHRDRSTTITCLNDEIEKLSQCSHCNHYMHEDANYTLIGYNDVICQSCYEDSYFTCEACNEVIHDDDYGSNGYCINCDRGRNATQYEHIELDQHDSFTDFKMTPAGRPDATTPSQYNYAIGLEIEAYSDHEQVEDDFQDNERDFACTLSEVIHDIWTEEQIPYASDFSACTFGNDGSLMNDRKRECRASFECEIMPLRVETCRKVWTNPEVLKAYSRLVDRTTDRCGLHISIAAHHDLPARVYVRINILMRALQLSEEKAKKILGRLPSAYPNNACPTIRNLKYNYLRGGEKTGPLALRERAKTISQHDDYQIGWFQSKLQGRFEFRAFRAPMQNDLILRRIEYAVSMVEWSKSSINGFYAMTYRDMIEHFEQYHTNRPATIAK